MRGPASRASSPRMDLTKVPKVEGGIRMSTLEGRSVRNATHESTTDPQARLYRKARGHEAKLAYLGHVVIENRNALVVGCEVTEALGQHMEREAAARLMAYVPRKLRATVVADRAYDTSGLVVAIRQPRTTP